MPKKRILELSEFKNCSLYLPYDQPSLASVWSTFAEGQGHQKLWNDAAVEMRFGGRELTQHVCVDGEALQNDGAIQSLLH